jgi:alpha,alpha-trehalase
VTLKPDEKQFITLEEILSSFDFPSTENILTPLGLFPELFERVSKSEVFTDPKDWVDVTFDAEPDVIMAAFRAEEPQTQEELTAFVNRYFSRQKLNGVTVAANSKLKSNSLLNNIEALWPKFRREAHGVPSRQSSVLELPHDYIVPGGRFSEIYYWDSYFAMLGFVDRDPETIQNMVDNFAHLIRRFGYVPNGNRTYYLGRSQPPFFHCLVSLLYADDAAMGYSKYLTEMLIEYAFWVEVSIGQGRSLVFDDGYRLSRYFDPNNAPREESYIFDLETEQAASDTHATLFTDIRAAAESGWDFTSRWFGDDMAMHAIRTTSVLPVDLNAILYSLEGAIAAGAARKGYNELVADFSARTKSRQEAINKYFWNSDVGFFCDYDLKSDKVRSSVTAAGLFPLFFGCASEEQASHVAEITEKQLLQRGGLVTSTVRASHQWDWPNGWAPLQWVAIQGLRRYGHTRLASEIRERWLNTVQTSFNETGKFYEKYNVIDSVVAVGGEYDTQEGFGWTNGVTAALLREE